MNGADAPTAHGGLSGLHVAVIAGQARRVSKIMQQNEMRLIDAGDADGTTPLMTAVLTGRQTIAQILLRNGASTHVRDCRGHLAVDYSKSSLFQPKLDTYRHLGLPEVGPEQQGKRVTISQLLRYPVALESCRRMGQHECSRALFFKEGAELNVMRPHLTFRIGKENLEKATTGFIASAMCPLVKTAAVSGWKANPVRGQDVLDNVKYLRLVRDLAGILKFTLTRSPRDNNGKSRPEHNGRFVSSHAEKKLATFWVIAVLKAMLDSTDLKRVHELRGMNIPEPWKEAWVFLDHTPCQNCWAFLHQVKQVTGISIYVETRPFLAKKNRQDDIGCRKCACARCKRRFGAEQARGTQPDTERCRSSKDTAVPGHFDIEDGASPALQDKNDGKCQRSASRITRPEVLTTTSRAPQTWRHFVDGKTGLEYAKPIPIPSPESAAGTPELREPISTIAGRSGFFATPDPGQSVEVQIPKMSSRARAEYDRISNVSSALDLGRFAYNPPAATAASVPKKATRQRKPQKSVGSGKKTKEAATSGRSRTRVSKLERTRVRSSFARAVERHQRRRAGKA